MKTLQVNKVIKSIADQDVLLGTWADDTHYDNLVDESCKVIDENGKILAVLVRGELAKEAAAAFYHAVHNKISKTDNRGTSSGSKHVTRVKKDGTMDKGLRAELVESSLMGYYDRYPRINYCRKTAFTEHYPDLYERALLSVRQVNDIFAKYHPERYAVQKAMADKSSPDFLIHGTVFTTVTLNKNFRTAYHRDAGDLPDGFGCLSYVQTGKFSGGYLVYPAYKTAFRLRTGDVLLFDPHEIHGNTAIKPYSKKYERITAIHYYRKKMIYCGTNEQELARAKDGMGKGPVTENLNPNWSGE